MRKILFLACLFTVLFPLSSHASNDPQTLTNKDVVNLVKAGLTAKVVIAKIKSTQSSFNTSTTALEHLKKSGVPDSVILAMINAPQQKVYVKCNFGKVGLHSDANIESSIVGWADCHSPLAVAGRNSGDWSRVRAPDGATGFILTSILGKDAPNEKTAANNSSQHPTKNITATKNRPQRPPLAMDELRAVAWRVVPWATTSYYRQPGTSSTDCTGQGQWLGSIFQSNLSCSGSYTSSQRIPITWYHYTIYNLVETTGSYALLACTRNWRWSKCSFMVPGNVFHYKSKKGHVWVKDVKFTLLATRPKSQR